MIDDDVRPTLYDERIQRARTEHRCCACGETIRRGDRYSYTFGVWDGSPSATRRCLRCDAIYTELCDRTDDGETVALALDCGQDWQDVFGEPPPDEIAALAFALPQDMQGVER